MKYLVNRETKEHLIIDENLIGKHYRHWNIVEADSEGWIPWSGGECPLPDNHQYEVTEIDGEIIKYLSRPQTHSWGINGARRISAYRPILAEQSEPKLFDHLVFDKNPETVFERLSSAVRASSEIPSIIAEINAMLPAGYEVAEKAKKVEPVEDMSDWRNWREGDILKIEKCLYGHGFNIGECVPIYRIRGENISCGERAQNWAVTYEEVSFHSRPTGSSK